MPRRKASAEEACQATAKKPEKTRKRATKTAKKDDKKNGDREEGLEKVVKEIAEQSTVE